MRKTVLTLVAVLLALPGVAAAPAPVRAAAAPVNPKVVIVVGATHSATPRYREYADQVYAEAIRYSTNVIRLYSPNATWASVKAAMQGASIVVYMGHGNGFPTPYSTGPRPTSQNGFGLNDPAKGLSDNNNTYYGESYIGSEVQLAPNAVVLLHHLCYAAGNSEPGKPTATLAVAKQRVDNYGAGFIRAGAAAVIADGHSHDPYYVRSLFTTRLTIDEIWRGAPNFHGNVSAFASTRSPGRTAQIDPDSPTGGYYRAVVGRLDTRTDDVTGAPYAATDGDPASFVLPGAASANADGATVFADAGLTTPAATLPVDTKLRLASQVGATVEGAAIFEASTPDGATTGFVSGMQLTPRDSARPQIWTVEDGDGAFSPNGDGRGDLYAFTARLSEEATWHVAFSGPDGSVLASRDGFGSEVAAAWDGVAGGVTVPDGQYGYTITGSDEWGNPVGANTGTFVVDTLKPSLGGLAVGGLAPVTFSPNGDGDGDQASVSFSTTEFGYVDVSIADAGGSVVRSFAVPALGGAGSFTWGGESDYATTVPDGTYRLSLVPRDRAGNVGDALASEIAVYTSLASVRGSPALFYPHDRDRQARTARFTFQLLRPATVTWTVTNAAGAVVRTIATDAALGAGSQAWEWDGRNDAGGLVPRGTYYSLVRATEGGLALALSASVLADGFRVTSNDSTPGRGQTVTITALSAERLARAPRLLVYQPGRAAWGATMRLVTGSTWRVSIRLPSSRTGTVRFKVVGTDRSGGSNWGALSLPLH